MKLEELHEKLIEMLCMFDALCRENGIAYFLDSGTALGAVREHDFIPWDDDIDIAIMRPEYERLRLVLKARLAPNYQLIEPRDYSPYFFDFIPKLIDKTVPLREETDEDRAYQNYQNRMSIDFIILDSVPDQKWKQKIICFRAKLLYGMARAYRFQEHSGKMTRLERISAGICGMLGKLSSLERILELYENNTQRYAHIPSGSLIRSNSVLYFIGFYRKSDYENTVYLPFHRRSFPLPAGYDAVLRQLYGDYMTPRRAYRGFFSHTES